MEKIITALASFGMSGRVFHGPLITKNNNFELKYILERTKELSKTHYPDAIIVRSFEEIINKAEVDLVVINTPPHLHFEMTSQALEAGKHVVVEKPFTPTRMEGEKLLEISKNTGKEIFVFHNLRWVSQYLTLKSVIEQGVLGELVEYQVNFNRYRPDISTKPWKETSLPGTGLLYDLGSHLIDQALQLFGFPDKIESDLRKTRNTQSVVDDFEINLYFDKLKVKLSAKSFVLGDEPSIVVYGKIGTFRTNIRDQQEALLTNSKNHLLQDYSNSYAIVDTKNSQQHINGIHGDWSIFYQNVFDVIKSNADKLVKTEEAIDVIRIIEHC